jgi:hypothetical protein
MSTNSEPRNPLYLLLLLASLLFVLTALAVAVVPMLEEKAAQAGAVVPESPFRDALRKDGWKWLLYEVAVVIVLGVASMWVDHRRLRRLQNGPAAGTMPATESNSPSQVAHEEPRVASPGAVPTDRLP